MSRKRTVTGIILKRHDYGEADRILTVLTKEDGKCVFLAKGVRKSSSKRQGHLELFSHVNISYHQGQGWGIVTEVESIEQFDAVSNSWEHLGHVFHVGEIVDRLLPEDEPHEKVYAILLRFLTALSSEHDEKRRHEIVRLCEQTLLEELGYWNTEEFGTYREVRDESQAKDRNLNYIQSILERDLKSIRIFDQPTPQPLYIKDH